MQENLIKRKEGGKFIFHRIVSVLPNEKRVISLTLFTTEKDR